MGSAKRGTPSVMHEANRRYELGDELGVGGMAVIHHAYDRLAQRQVAYKRLRVLGKNSRARATALFEREYDTLARLPHPNIVEVYDYGKDAFGPYYTMELLTGSDLTVSGPLPFREACRIVRDIASALALVHARRLIHRDVSPNNIRLTSDGRAKLLDFGALTSFGAAKEIVGTPAFLAPECLEGKNLDQRSDIYSLGAVAYWALTKKTPLRARSLEELQQCLNVAITPPSHLASQLPKELDALVMGMLALDPMARPSSCAHIIDRLTALAELDPEVEERRVAFSYLAHPPLAGRRTVIAELEAALARGEQGSGVSIMLEADSGFGRSALLDAVVLSAEQRGAIVLRARGEAGIAPFSLARKFTEHTFTIFPELKDQFGDRDALLAGGLRTNASLVQAADRHAALLELVQSALLQASKRSTLALVVDDLHLADTESVALLASLSQEIAQERIVVVTSALRTGAHTIDSAYLKLRASGERIALAPLDADCMVELVESIFGDVPNTKRVAQWLQQESAGVPGHALDLARFLLRTGTVRYALGTFALPHDIDANVDSVNLSQAVRARISDLDAETREVAQLLSLHEGALTPEQIADAARREPHVVLRSLERLKSENIASSSEQGFALSGSSLRSALRSTLDEAQCKALHLRLGDALLTDAVDEQRLSALLHMVDGGAAERAADLMPIVRDGQVGARWVRLLEAVLAVYRARRNSEAEQLTVLLPLVYAGFYGDAAAMRRHIDDALAIMSRVSGLTLATKLRYLVGGRIAFILGVLWATLRRAVRPPAARGRRIPAVIGDFIGAVIAGVATAASSMDGAAAKRYVTWLTPLAYLPKQSTPALMRQYCVAIAETSAGEFERASRRYARLIPAFSKPVKNLDDQLRTSVYLGALNGRAQAEASSSSKETLALADELGRGDPFYAPHAECARMSYYSHRGEVHKAEVHRARAELLALRGGTSWSAVTILTVRVAYAAMFTRDAIRLMQAIAELDRLQAIAPKLATTKALCEAFLEALRGRHAQSIALYEQVIDTTDARSHASWRGDRSLFATVLNEAGQHERAKRICVELVESSDVEEWDYSRMMPQQQIAIADSYLGDLHQAAGAIDKLIALAERLDNPLQLGFLHRDRARMALRSDDLSAVRVHYDKMSAYFRSAGNPSVIQIGDALLAELKARDPRSLPNAALAENDGLDGSTVMEEYEDVGDASVAATRSGSSPA